ncbi:cytoplasmic protein [Actinomadura barringtoniae]|uniref:Cytoplasmic protein n=1 Tax=Actinomadura barringtoniae TaxID=1427535 RepID=A0A939PDN0_9ACTN|nr:glutamine amidotransferase [Actinomadura barringtoniae]MBO2447764.1 cytoplasmic protein [Actinomadura barringtoniae]
MSRVLIAGESWVTQSTHIKGVDSFTVSSYVVGADPLRRALESRGHEVVHLPAHLVPAEFPGDAEALGEYDVIVLSDIGANSVQLSPQVFEQATPGQDRIAALRGWVGDGGGLLMVGGYLSFTGFEAKAAYRNTVLHEVLPVELLPEDDRVELPAGAHAQVTGAAHPALGGVEGDWPALLGYNRVRPRDGAEVLATINADPLVAVGTFGSGRSAVFTSDCSPHWAPTPFCEDWDGYARVFGGLIEWLAR